MDSSLASQAMLAVAQRWKWLALGAAMAAVAAATFLLIQPASFASSVSIVPRRARTEVDFDTRIRTVSSEGVLSGQGAPMLSSATAERRQALAQLARTAEIEEDVRAQLGDRLPAEFRAPGRLVRLVTARVVPRSEVIAIEVTAPSPALAELVAKTWAQAYEQRINTLYGSNLAGIERPDGDLDDARRKYQAAEDALTSFVASEPLSENSRQLESRQRLLQDLTLVQQSETVDLYKIAHRVDLLVLQADALLQQLNAAQDDSAAATSAAALVLIKTQAFASSMALPSSLQLQFSGGPVAPSQPGGSPPPVGNSAEASGRSADPATVSRAMQDWMLPGNLQIEVPPAATTATLAQQRGDVTATIRALQEWRYRLAESIRDRTSQTPEGGAEVAVSQSQITQAVGRLEAEARQLQGMVAGQAARQRALQQERDILWESYSSILKKAEENRVATLVAAGKEVSIAGQSLAEPKSRRLDLYLPIAVVLGAAGGAALALLIGLVAPAYQDFLIQSERTNGRSKHPPPAPRPNEAISARG